MDGEARAPRIEVSSHACLRGRHRAVARTGKCLLGKSLGKASRAPAAILISESEYMESRNCALTDPR